jgi:hypothetical protein
VFAFYVPSFWTLACRMIRCYSACCPNWCASSASECKSPGPWWIAARTFLLMLAFVRLEQLRFREPRP